MTDEARAALELLRELHGAVDERAAGLALVHAGRLQCAKGCSACCVDGQSVFGVEAERIRSEHPQLLATGVPHPEGACAFLDEDGACRVYESRPYRCRTQGLPLRWFDEGPGGEPVEYRDACELNFTEGIPVEQLPGEDCWELGPVEGRLAALDSDFTGGLSGRIPLRALFLKSSPGS